MNGNIQAHKVARHHAFDTYWEKHKGLVWHMAKKIAPRLHTTQYEIVGSLTIWFNFTLYSYEENKGKFSSYFCAKCLRYILFYWIRRESQSWDNFVATIHRTPEQRELSDRNFAQHEVDFHLYRVPEEDESDVHTVIEFFDTVDDCWEFMTRQLDPTDRQMLELYYKHDWSGSQISEKFKVTKQRVFQRLERARGQIKIRLKQVSALAELFDIPSPDEEP